MIMPDEYAEMSQNEIEYTGGSNEDLAIAGAVLCGVSIIMTAIGIAYALRSPAQPQVQNPYQSNRSSF